MTKATYESLLAARAAADASAERQQLMTVPGEQPRRIPMKSPGGIAPETTNARTWTAMQRGSRPSQTSLPISTASSPRTASGVHTSARLRWRDRPDQQQRMELTAPMMALEALTRTGGGAPLHRQHLRPQRVTKWVLGWERRLEGRRQAAGEERHRVEWFWVKGHAGVHGPAEHRSRCHLSSVIGVLLLCDTIFSG